MPGPSARAPPLWSSVSAEMSSESLSLFLVFLVLVLRALVTRPVKTFWPLGVFLRVGGEVERSVEAAGGSVLGGCFVSTLREGIVCGEEGRGYLSYSMLLMTVEPAFALFPFLPAPLLLLPFAVAAVHGAGMRPCSTAFLRRRLRRLVMATALTGPPVVRSVCGETSECFYGR